MNKLKTISIIFFCFHLSGCVSINVAKNLQPVDLERYPLPQNKFLISLINFDARESFIHRSPTTENQIRASLLQSGYFEIGDGDNGCELKIFAEKRSRDSIVDFTGLFPLFTWGIVPGGQAKIYQLYSEIICDDKVIVVVESESNATEILGFFSLLFGTSEAIAQKTFTDDFVSRIIQSIHDNDGVLEALENAS